MSYNRTVRCSSCYKTGHNRTGCPELKAAWEQDPESWQGKQWQRILDKKAKPRKCGYCDVEGHTRAQCENKKRHMSIYQKDLNLWRKALVKAFGDLGLGKGALVRCNNASFNAGDRWSYPRDEDYVAPVGLVMEHSLGDMSHFQGIMNSNQWLEGSLVAVINRLQAAPDAMRHQRIVGLGLPSLQGLVPRMGKGYWGGEQIDRNERVNNSEWEVVSPAVAPFDTDEFLSADRIRKDTKNWFKGGRNANYQACFAQFKDFQRDQLQQYVNGEIELSEMIDPKVPTDDT